MDSKNLKYSSFFLTVGIFIASGSTFAQNIILGRMLTKSDYVSLMKILSIIGFCVVIAEFGLTQLSTIKFAEIYRNSNNGLKKFFLKVFFISISYSGLIGISLYFSSNILYEKYKIFHLKPALLFGLSWILILSINKILLAFSIGQKLHFHSLCLYSVIQPIQAITLFIAFFLFKINNPLEIFFLLNKSLWLAWFLIILLFSYTFITKFSFLFKKNKILRKKNTNLDKKIFPENIHFYIPFLTKYLIPYIIVLIPGMFLEANKLSLILICIPLLNIFDLLFQGINHTLLSQFPKNVDHLKNQIKKISKFILIAAVSVFILLQFLKNNLIISLYGLKYSASTKIFSILLCASLIDSFRNIAEPLLNTQGFSKFIMYADLTKIIILSAGFYFLIPLFGINGLLFSYLFSFLISILLKFYFLEIKLNINLRFHFTIYLIFSLSTFIYIITN